MRRALPFVLLVAALSGCNSGSSGAASCGDPQAQRIDPLSSQHLLPGAPEPEYLTDPPTSGAHRLGDHPTGVLDEPIERAVQVAMLEGGNVLVQYDRSVALADRRTIEKLADNALVTVAPNEDLDDPIVATAWLYTLRCDGVDASALSDFIEARAREEGAH